MNLISTFSPAVEFFSPGWGWKEYKAFPWRFVSCFSDNRRSFEHLERVLGIIYERKQIGFFNSGKSSITNLLQGWGIQKGDEVLVPSFICDSVYHAVLKSGATPVDVDVEPGDLNISLKSLMENLSSRTKAVIVAHLFGNPADISHIEKRCRERNVFVLDDAAQSFGAKLDGRFLGGWGDGGVVSLGPGKSTVGPRGGIGISKNPLAIPKATDSCLSIFGSYARFLVSRCFRKYSYPFLYLVGVFRSLGKRILGKEANQQKEGNLAPFHVAKMDSLDADVAAIQIHRVLDSLLEVRKANYEILHEALKGESKIQIVKALRGESSYVKFVFVLKNGDPERLFSFFHAHRIEVYPSYNPTGRFRRTGGGVPFFPTALETRCLNFLLMAIKMRCAFWRI